MADKGVTKVLIFGNLILKQDSVPLKLLGRLQNEFPKIKFIEFDPNDDLEKEGRQLNIIDCVQSIKKVTLITEIDKVVTSKIYSMHDFDLGYSLKLLKKFNYLDNVRIFGVPMNMGEDKAFNELVPLIRATLS